MAELTRQELLAPLPVHDGELTLRPWTRKDLEDLARWAPYPFPYETFDFSFRGMEPEERDRYFRAREEDAGRVTLVLDHRTQPAIGLLGHAQIDWSRRTAGNMVFRVAPSWCDRGVGTRALLLFARWSFEAGLVTLRLDVAGSNDRAIRCYEKAGFARTGEFWRDAEDLREIDLGRPRYDFLRPHVRRTGSVHQLRFYWMEHHAPR